MIRRATCKWTPQHQETLLLRNKYQRRIVLTVSVPELFLTWMQYCLSRRIQGFELQDAHDSPEDCLIHPVDNHTKFVYPVQPPEMARASHCRICNILARCNMNFKDRKVRATKPNAPSLGAAAFNSSAVLGTEETSSTIACWHPKGNDTLSAVNSTTCVRAKWGAYNYTSATHNCSSNWRVSAILHSILPLR